MPPLLRQNSQQMSVTASGQFQADNSKQSSSSPVGKSWSREDELALIEVHADEGNKWVSIAKRLHGERSQLEVKVGVGLIPWMGDWETS